MDDGTTALQRITGTMFWENYAGQEDEAAQLLGLVRRRMATGFYGDEVDYVGQRWCTRPGEQWCDGDVYAFMRVWAGLRDDTIRGWEIPVGAGPASDSRWRENEATLTASLPDGFEAEVAEATNSDLGDGTLFYWHSDEHVWGDVPQRLPIPYGRRPPADIEEGTPVPLEIGYTAASTTWLHLGRFGCLARSMALRLRVHPPLHRHREVQDRQPHVAAEPCARGRCMTDCAARRAPRAP